MNNTPLKDEIIARAIESSGQRLTRQKMEVFHYMQEHGIRHPTAEDVYFGVKGAIPSISLGTVYNCLEALVSCKLLNRLTIAGTTTHRYEMRGHEHHHFRCIDCGTILDVHAEIPVKKVLPGPHDFEVTEFQLQLSGYCPDCKGKKKHRSE
jgi:Fe2+ or Zn2+ uptake regulation protein